MKTFDAELLRAAEILEREAEGIFRSYTLKGRWVIEGESDRRMRDDHDEMLALAKRFRALAASIH